MGGRKKCRTMENDKCERKRYIEVSNSGAIKVIIKIRLHMWHLKANYGRKDLDNRCQSEDHTTGHVLECNKEDKKLNLNDERGKEWRETVEIYRKNKENISKNNIGEEQNTLEEQKKRAKRIQNLEEHRRTERQKRRKYKKKLQKN